MVLSNIMNKKQIKQKTQEWFNIRKTIITATDASVILNCNPYKSKKDLLLSKNNKEHINITNNAMEWGVKYEPIAISILENILNIKIKEVGLLIHDNLTWLGASPDGLTNSNILVEIKCVYNRKIDNNVQTIYWIQMQIQMEVCNIDECYIFQGKFIETNKDIYDNCTDKYKGIDNNYWILDSYMYKIIKRDKKWFKNVKDELYQFWREVYFTKI